MRLTEIRYGNAVPIDGYGPGFFRIGGEIARGPVLVLPSGVVPWGGFDDDARLLAEADSFDVLLVGTGTWITPLPPGFRKALEAAGVGVEMMSSPSACRTCNVLLAEGRRVALALIPI